MEVTIDGQNWLTCEFCQMYLVKRLEDLVKVETPYIDANYEEQEDVQYACPICAHDLF